MLLVCINNTYDVSIAFETIYLTRPCETFKEVSRITKQDGQFILLKKTDENNSEDVNGGIEYLYTLETYLINTCFKSVEKLKKENDYIQVVIE